ncbi:putative WRKY transcription factor 41 [Platanthera zijinensis]|uniref:WRKY transcription factor 41 n=1 Tax=Platanthera zijinensis TaxID=2320716 RepID=A0AAP0BTB1_9ASPA
MGSSTAIVLSELIQLHSLAKTLSDQLNQSQVELSRTIARDIIFAIEKTICAAKTCIPGEAEHELSNGRVQFFDKTIREFDCREQKMPKKRKTLRGWASHVRVSTEEGAEMPHDGHSWRKYGQKDILGAKYPRAYYRCTHRKNRGCSAMKQVQKSTENPSVLDITYLGNHTCSNSQQDYSASKSHLLDQHQRFLDRQKNLIKHLDFQSQHNQDPKSMESFPSSVVLDGTKADNEFFFSSPLMSPVSTGSNCLSLPPFDPELDELISAAISEAESPVMDFDFMREFGMMDVETQFDTSIFFA